MIQNLTTTKLWCLKIFYFKTILRLSKSSENYFNTDHSMSIEKWWYHSKQWWAIYPRLVSIFSISISIFHLLKYLKSVRSLIRFNDIFSYKWKIFNEIIETKQGENSKLCSPLLGMISPVLSGQWKISVISKFQKILATLRWSKNKMFSNTKNWFLLNFKFTTKI